MDWKKGLHRAEFSITTYCQAKCPLCMRTEAIESKGAENFPLVHMPVHEFEGMVEKLSRDSQITQIELCGDYGDPFIHPDIFRFIHFSIEKGFKVDISTNGGMHKSSDYKKLGETYRENLEICFSIDGFSKATNEMYRVGVDFERAFENMMTFNQANPKHAFWHFIVFKYNMHEIDAALEFAYKNDLKLKFVINKKDWEHKLDDEEVSVVKKQIQAFSEKIAVKDY